MLFIRRLTWDNWNMAHIARHGVIPEEVEEVCHGDYVVRQGYKNRIILVGPTRTRKMLAVMLESEGGGVYYPVTARPASRRERGIYRREREGEAQ